MSMIGHLMQISPELLEKMKDDMTSPPHTSGDPSYLVVYPYEGDPPVDRYPGTEEPLSLYKYWNDLHWLLTGKSEGGEGPLARALFGGTPIGKDLGNGPATYLEPTEVREIASALAQLSGDDVRRRFDPEAMGKAEIYPALVDRSDPGWADAVSATFDQVATYFRDAAAKGNAVLQWMD